MSDATELRDAPGPRTATELAARLSQERQGQPFLLLRDEADRQVLIGLDPARGRMTLGRDPGNDIALGGDPEISRVHAELLRVGGEWVIADQGISRNGTFVNGAAIQDRHRLSDGDVLRLGRTLITVAVPPTAGAETTLRSPVDSRLDAVVEELTPMQRRILGELCRPLVSGDSAALPAANQEIADTVGLSVQGVKSQLRTLTERFGFRDLPQNRKRLALAEQAVRSGLGGPTG